MNSNNNLNTIFKILTNFFFLDDVLYLLKLENIPNVFFFTISILNINIVQL